MEINYRPLDIEESELAVNFVIKEMVINNQFQSEKTELLFMKYTLARCYENRMKYIGAFDKTKLVGAVGYEDNYINNLYVNELYQRKGIASHLLKEALVEIKNNGFNQVKLESTVEGELFYKHHGFTEDDQKIRIKYIPFEKDI